MNTDAHLFLIASWHCVCMYVCSGELARRTEVEGPAGHRGQHGAVHLRVRVVPVAPGRQEHRVRAVDQHGRQDQERQRPIHTRAQPVPQQTGQG